MKFQTSSQSAKAPLLRTAALFLFCLCIMLGQSGLADAALPPIENFPRAIKLDNGKFREAGNQAVRVLKIDGKNWLLPTPGGFTDIENAASPAELPIWLEVAAYNLSERNVAYRADSIVIPPYSQAHLYIHPEQAMAEAFVDYPQGDGQVDDPQLAADLEKLLRGVTPIKKELWAATANGRRSTHPYFWLTRFTSPYYWMIGEDQRVLVRVGWAEGEVSAADQNQRAEADAKMQDAGGDGVVVDSPVPGRVGGTLYPSIVASLVFPCNGSYVGMKVEFGPLRSQSDVFGAVYTLISWQRTFTGLNTPK